MADTGQTGGRGPESVSYNIFYRFLRLFADIRPGEALTVFLLTLNIFLLLLAYYLIKPVREALVIASLGPLVRSCLAGAQAILFIFVIKGFSRLSSKVPRQLLITWVTVFFISNLGLFYLFHLWRMPMRTMAVAFFIWVGIFSLMVVAQFWGFANDIYNDEDGKRLFPLIAVGQTCGAVFGSSIALLIIRPLGAHFAYIMMLMTAGLLGIPIALTIVVHNREIRQIRERAFKVDPKIIEEEKVKEQPLKKGGGFRLIFQSRYLLFYAFLIFFLNYVNYMGENIWGLIVKQAAVKAVHMGMTGGMNEAQYTAGIYSEYQFLYNVIALVVQLFLVSRIFKWVGVSGALLIFPLIALGGYTLVGLGASLVLIKWVKGFENGVDYSLMNTTKGALFLITSREEKYKAKAASETFFYRGGDALAALIFFIGLSYLHFTVESFAKLNVVVTLIWIVFCFLVIREYKKIKARAAVPALGQSS
ncbi:MAG: Npt1/Npt2 family nucleotide transporter [Candidatus Aminicenantales bacterium]|jgi:AAA family ATP:ADP antiporter